MKTNVCDTLGTSLSHTDLKLFLRLFALCVLLLCGLQDALAVEFTAHGYYRVRTQYTHDLDLQHPNAGIVPGDPANDSNDRFGAIAFAQQRFRIQPHLKLNDHLSIHSELDLLDNLLFGQSDVSSLQIANPITGTLELPAANGPFGITGGSAGSTVGSGGGNINVRQVYMDIMTSAGKFRIGRQASHFGLGILTNDGEGRDSDFGDVFDRILYLAGLDLPNGHRLNIGLAYDFAFEASQDPSINGLDGAVDSNWNDALQTSAVLLYQANNFEAGVFAALRYRDGDDGQPTTTAVYVDTLDEDGDGSTNDGIIKPAGIDGDTLLYVLDGYTRFNFAKYYTFGLEAVYIFGKMAPGVAVDATILDDPAQAGISNPVASPIEIPLSGTQNDVSIFMAAVELDAKWDWGGEANLKAGYASGDQEPLSSKITQLGFRQDYDIALMMFNMPLGTSPAIRVGGITELGRKPITPNYINNAIYFALGYKHEFDITSGVPWAEDFKVGLKGVTAFAPANQIDLDFAEITGTAGLPHIKNTGRWYGLEIDASVEATFFEFLHWSTVAGVFMPGNVYDIARFTSAPGGVIDSILPDPANMAFAIKTNLVLEF